MKKFEEVLDVLEYGELMRFKKDLDSGAMEIKKAIEEKVKKKLKEHEKTCAVCSNDIDFYRTSNYTLLFGPDDFKKKASFCGLDCLEYFISKLKKIKAKRREESMKNSGSVL